MTEYVTASIDPTWAEEMAQRDAAYDIFRFNWNNGEAIQDDINLEGLGGLVVSLANPHTIDRHERVEIHRRRSVIDLAFEEPAYGVLTSELLTAAEKQCKPNAQFIDQLHTRMIPDEYHGTDEAWFIPTRAVRISEVLHI